VWADTVGNVRRRRVEGHASTGCVVLEAEAYVDALLEVVPERNVEDRRPLAASSTDVVSPPWTTARSYAAR
jgi:hypothetical protein